MSMLSRKDAIDRLINAALDQPKPSRALTEALQDVLTTRVHPARLRSRDPIDTAGREFRA